MTRESVIAGAMDLVDAEGLQALTTTRLARRLGITQPSLYAHVTSLEEIRAEVATRGVLQLSGEVRDAVKGRSGDDAFAALADAYRVYVRRHPDRYLLQSQGARTDEFTAAAERSMEAVRAVLRTFGLSEEEAARAHTAFRASVHGFAHLEARNALPTAHGDSDENFRFFVRVFSAGLRKVAADERRAARASRAPSH